MTKGKIYISILLGLLFNPLYAQVDIVCVGNSITWGNELDSPTHDSYPSQLEVLLGSAYEVTNRGAPGRTLLRNTVMPYVESGQYFYSLAKSHDIVIILLGTNDSDENNWADPSHFKEDYFDLIDDYKNYPGHPDPIFIMGLPPPVFDESKGHRNAPIVDEINPMIKQVANETNSIVVDFYKEFDGHPELFLDGVHPNEEGAGIMAKLVSNAIHKALDPIPTPPTGLKAIPGTNSIQLIWNADSEKDVVKYYVYRSNNRNEIKVWQTTLSVLETTWTDNAVQNNQAYYYHILSGDLLGKKSDPSKTVVGSVFNQTPPSTPTSVQLTQKGDEVIVYWEPNTEFDLANYRVYRNKDEAELIQGNTYLGSVSHNHNIYYDLSFNDESTYYYGVQAIDISGNQSTISTPVSIITKSRPVSADTTVILYEDIPHSFSSDDFPFTDADSHTLEKIVFIDSDSYQYYTYYGIPFDSNLICEDISKLVFTAGPEEYGDRYSVFAFKVIDSFGSTSIDTNFVLIDLSPINDTPHINPISDINIVEDTHNILIPISGISAGPENESQNLTVTAYANNTTLVNTNIQYASPSSAGQITLDPLENIFGTTPMNVRVVDDGGIENGGVDSTIIQFNLHIDPINDPPIFKFIDKIQILEDSETTVELTGVQAGPWEIGQKITMSVNSDNTDILPDPVLNYSSPDTSAFLTFTTIPNLFGTSSVTIMMQDDGGIELGGSDSTSYTVPVEITSVNDEPIDFSIIVPTIDSTIVINKRNYNNLLNLSWESTSDIENDKITYNVIFDDDLAALSRYDLGSTSTDYFLREILAVTDTISITSGKFSIIATDGESETVAKNSGVNLTIDGRSFAPANLHLDQNYPNPFNNTTLIGFDLPKRTAVSLIIYDLLGEEIISLIDNKIRDRGYNTVIWNGLDSNDKVLPAGIYLMQVRTTDDEQHKKLILLK